MMLNPIETTVTDHLYFANRVLPPKLTSYT